MLQFTEALQRVLRLPVLDQTSLTGNYYCALEFAREDHAPDTDVTPLFAGIRESLGWSIPAPAGGRRVLWQRTRQTMTHSIEPSRHRAAAA
jgi:uncharacterized protein (TIGR03435 family)